MLNIVEQIEKLIIRALIILLLAFSGIFLTRMACPPGSLDSRFLRGLESARSFRIEGNNLFIDLAGDNGMMKFFKVVRQN